MLFKHNNKSLNILIFLIIPIQATLILNPKNTMALKGDNVTFECQTDSNKNITWSVYYFDRGQVNISNTSSVFLENVQNTDIGIYLCRENTSIIARAKLVVIDPSSNITIKNNTVCIDTFYYGSIKFGAYLIVQNFTDNSTKFLTHYRWYEDEVCTYFDKSFDNLSFQYVFYFGTNNEIWLEPHIFISNEYVTPSLEKAKISYTAGSTTSTVIIVYVVLIFGLVAI